MNNNRHFAHGPCAGIDKLSITVKDFQIKDASRTGLILQPGQIDLATGSTYESYLFTDGGGKKFEGQKAYLNHSKFNLSINKFGLQVIINPSKPYHPYDLCQDDKVLQERTQAVFKHLYDKGIRANYHEARVSRVDIAKNALMKHPIVAYNPIMHMLRIPRAKRQANYPDGYSSNNKQFGFNSYNKGKELKEVGHKELIGIDDKLMRQELQYKTKNSVSNKLQIVSVQSLFDAGINHLNKIYVETLSGIIYKTDEYTSNQFAIPFDNHVQILIELREKFPQQFINIWFKTHAVLELIEKTGSIKTLESILVEAGCHRNTIRKKIHEVRYMLGIRAKIKNDGIAKLYRELILKFAS